MKKDEEDPRRKDKNNKVSDETCVKGIPWRTLKHKLGDKNFDALTFVVSNALKTFRNLSEFRPHWPREIQKT